MVELQRRSTTALEGIRASMHASEHGLGSMTVLSPASEHGLGSLTLLSPVIKFHES